MSIDYSDAEGLFENNRRNHIAELHDPVFRADNKTRLIEVASYYLTKLKYDGKDDTFVQKEMVLIDAMIKLSCEDIDLFELPLIYHHTHGGLMEDLDNLISRMKKVINHAQHTLIKHKQLFQVN